MLEELLTRREVAAIFRVSPRTIIRWERAGRLTSIALPSGIPRYRRSEVERLMGDTGGRVA